MWENLHINRLISNFLPSSKGRRLLILTGARQTGKTVLVKRFYNHLPYFNLDAIEYRDQLSDISSFRWATEIGKAILDEIQKEASLIDKVKYSFDEGNLDFSVLTGSSRILLLKKVRETMAGRIIIRELFPFMFNELIDSFIQQDQNILFEEILNTDSIDNLLSSYPSVVLGEEWELLKLTELWLYTWGGMPPLVHFSVEQDRKDWLNDYTLAYLERDLSDLANLNDLKPFRRFQQISALRTSNLLSYTDLARDTGIGIETARRYLEYLNISYQAFLISPFRKNLTSQLVKTPKLYWYDNGLLRILSGLGFDLDSGQLYENYVAAELMKYIHTKRLDASLSFYRTRSGMEIDFIIECKKGFLAFECKNREKFSSADLSSLKRVSAAGGDQFIAGCLIYRGNKLQKVGEKLWAIPSARLFSS